MQDSMQTHRMPINNIIIQRIAITTAKLIAKVTLISIMLRALVVVTVIRGMVTLSLM